MEFSLEIQIYCISIQSLHVLGILNLYSTYLWLILHQLNTWYNDEEIPIFLRSNNRTDSHIYRSYEDILNFFPLLSYSHSISYI